jgi:hypothetical protein
MPNWKFKPQSYGKMEHGIPRSCHSLSGVAFTIATQTTKRYEDEVIDYWTAISPSCTVEFNSRALTPSPSDSRTLTFSLRNRSHRKYSGSISTFQMYRAYYVRGSRIHSAIIANQLYVHMNDSMTSYCRRLKSKVFVSEDYRLFQRFYIFPSWETCGIWGPKYLVTLTTIRVLWVVVGITWIHQYSNIEEFYKARIWRKKMNRRCSKLTLLFYAYQVLLHWLICRICLLAIRHVVVTSQVSRYEEARYVRVLDDAIGLPGIRVIAILRIFTTSTIINQPLTR